MLHKFVTLCLRTIDFSVADGQSIFLMQTWSPGRVPWQGMAAASLAGSPVCVGVRVGILPRASVISVTGSDVVLDNYFVGEGGVTWALDGKVGAQTWDFFFFLVWLFYTSNLKIFC